MYYRSVARMKHAKAQCLRIVKRGTKLPGLYEFEQEKLATEICFLCPEVSLFPVVIKEHERSWA